MPDLLTRLRAALTGRYTIERELARGGMALVYLAVDLKHHRPVAIKVLRPELATAIGPERFLREIEIAAHLTYPNILPLYDSGEADGFLYYVMPYVEGESLRDRLIREKQLPIEDAVRITREVADALSYAHSQGLIHRDVKPENILFESGHAMVSDFGVARAISAAGGEQLTQAGSTVGTPAYMSPEQATGDAGLDGRSDQYSLACVVYEMLVGEPPFPGPTAQAVMARHVHERPPSIQVVRPTVPRAIQEAVEVALAKVPADRYSTTARFADALMTTWERRARGARAPLAVSLAAALVVALGVVAWLWLRPVPPGMGGSAATPPSDPARIAVLYFDDLSGGGAGLGPVAAGLTEHLIDELGRVPALHVISPDGVKPYRGTAPAPHAVARDLGVGTLVTGSVAQSQGRLRVTVRLTDPVTGLQLLSQSVERARGDLFQLQNEIAQEVSRGLRQRLGRMIELQQGRAATTSADAWELVQRAEAMREEADQLADREEASRRLVQADSLLAEAERRDPHWSEPIVLRGWLAYDHTGIPMAGNPTAGVSAGRPTEQWIRLAVRAAERALAVRPGDPAALELRGTIYYRVSNLRPAVVLPDLPQPLESAERDLRAAVALPFRAQARAWSTLSIVLEAAGKYGEANLAAQRAYEADAYLRNASDIVFRLFKTSFELERPAEALRWCEQGRRRFPADWYFPYCELQLLGWPATPAPDAQQTWRVVADLRRVAAPDVWAWLGPRVEMMAAAVLARAGLPDSAERVLRRARAAAPEDSQLLYYEAVARLRLGQRDSTLQLLQALVQTSPEDKPYLRKQVLFRPLWDDPRFRAIMRD